MKSLVRDVLTPEVLIGEAGAVGGELAGEMAALLRLLPEGYVVERVQGRVAPGRDPGAEYTLIDRGARPPRLVGTVSRRLIARQRISWTGRQLAGPTAAEAFGVLLQLAAADARGRRDG